MSDSMVKVNMVMQLTRPRNIPIYATPDSTFPEGDVIAEPTFPKGTRVTLLEFDRTADHDEFLSIEVYGMPNTFIDVAWSDVEPI